MRKRILHTALVLTALLLAACEHKELCLDHDACRGDWQVYVSAVYDLRWEYPENESSPQWQELWNPDYEVTYESLCPVKPSGLRVLEYNTTLAKHHISNIPPDGGEVNLTQNAYAMLMYNNDTEYILFEDLDQPVKTLATTRSTTRASYLGNRLNTSQKAENTVNQPDVLFCSFLRNLNKDRAAQDGSIIRMPMTPVTYTYLVRCKFSRGTKYLALGRGALAGMAAGCYLYDGSTTDEAATVLFDGTVRPWGIQATVRTFGVPGYPAIYTRVDNPGRQYLLNIEVRLTNGDTKQFDIDVTDQVAAQPRGGVIEVDGLEITDEEGMSKGGGFDVEVNGWGEFETIPLPL